MDRGAGKHVGLDDDEARVYMDGNGRERCGGVEAACFENRATWRRHGHNSGLFL